VVKKKTKTTWECTCELPSCGKSWESQGEEIPKQCRWCFSRRWNGVDNSPKPRMITVNGKTKRLSEWATETGISKQTIRYRLTSGWTPDEALGFTKHQVRRERKP
jgi:hypothetical protein